MIHHITFLPKLHQLSVLGSFSGSVQTRERNTQTNTWTDATKNTTCLTQQSQHMSKHFSYVMMMPHITGHNGHSLWSQVVSRYHQAEQHDTRLSHCLSCCQYLMIETSLPSSAVIAEPVWKMLRLALLTLQLQTYDSTMSHNIRTQQGYA